jgi:LPS export ABC transporter protein LptC
MRHCSIAAIAAVSFLALAGCGRPRPPAPEQTAPPPKPGVGHEIEETTMRFADPKGRWKFEVKAERVEAATVHGPYAMTPATARYDEPGKPSVTMSAKRARVDEQARRVVLEGDVTVASPTWRLQADRVEYHLNSGQVAASGDTKWVFAEGSGAAAQSPSSAKEGRH